MAIFDPNNPFNLRGIKISPANPDGKTAKHDVNYYVCFVDVDANQEGGVSGANFVLADPEKNDLGNTLRFVCNQNLVVPDENTVTKTFLLGVITNQKLDKPDLDPSVQNLFISLQYGNGISAPTKGGNPNAGKPPVFKAIDNADPLTCVALLVNSATDSSMASLVVMTNTGKNNNANNAASLCYENQTSQLYIEIYSPANTTNDSVVAIAAYMCNPIQEGWPSVVAKLVATGETGPSLSLNPWSSIPFSTI